MFNLDFLLYFYLNFLEIMAELAGLEPVTSAVTGQRSNQLSYSSKCKFFFELFI